MTQERILLNKPNLGRPIYSVDASVVLKWFSKTLEEDLEKAGLIREKFKKREIDLLAPELLIYEVINVLRYKPDLEINDVNKAIESIFEMRILEKVNKEVMKKAAKLAKTIEATVYDTTYLAFAESLRSPLITADEKFYQKISSRPDVILLKDFEE